MYLAKAYVKLDKNKVKELKAELLNLGYTYTFSFRDTQKDKYLLISKGECFTWFDIFPDEQTNYINCNSYTDSEEEAIKLAIELAKMDDKTSMGRWCIKIKEYGYIDKDDEPIIGFIGKCNKEGWVENKHFRFATPLELAEAVKNKKIKL